VVQDPRTPCAPACRPTRWRAWPSITASRAVDLPALLVHLVGMPTPDPGARLQVPLETYEDVVSTLERAATGPPIGVESGLTCPECSGILREFVRGTSCGSAAGWATRTRARRCSKRKAKPWRRRCGPPGRALDPHRQAGRERARHGHDGIAALFDDRSMAFSHDVQMLRALIGRGRALRPVGDEGS